MLDIKKGAEFFAAANSGNGFVSFYDEIFNSKRIARRYLIKGGPGTGKSSFLLKLAKRAERRGAFVEYYRCSSDPSSLDGIIINGKIAIVDSTAPHAVEPVFVGARDSIIDFGAFWNAEKLGESLEQIIELSDKKKGAYGRAYRFLSSAMQSEAALREMVLPYVDFSRMKRLVTRLVRNIDSDGVYERKTRILSAIGMEGRSRLDSFEYAAKKTVLIEDYYGLGALAISAVLDFAKENKNRVSVSFFPLSCGEPDAVCFEKTKIAFVVKNTRSEKAISLRRIFDLTTISQKEKSSLRERARSAKKASDFLVDNALKELALAGEAHFELEEIYKKNMNFSALNAFTDRFWLDLRID